MSETTIPTPPGETREQMKERILLAANQRLMTVYELWEKPSEQYPNGRHCYQIPDKSSETRFTIPGVWIDFPNESS